MHEGVTMVPHTADLQLHVQAKTIKELFQRALLGMFDAIEPEILQVRSSLDTIASRSLGTSGMGDLYTYNIELKAPDKEQLLVDFLSHALYLSDTNKETITKVDIQELTEHHIKASVHGQKITGFAKEIKAVTYHNLAIAHKDGLWQTDIVFDI